MMTFAEELAALRKERHITQEQLANEMNVSRTTISRWEMGKALPDIETVKRLSQVMDHDFFTGKEQMTAFSPEEKSAVDTSAVLGISARCKHRRGWLYVAGGVCLVVLFLLLMFVIRAVSAKNQRAEIVVTPSTTVAYLVPFDEDADNGHYGWKVDFAFENRSDVPFTPEKIVGYYYCGDELVIPISMSYEDIWPWMGNDKLLKSNSPLNWPFGADILHLTHLTVTIYGVDDNGHKIESSATVQYSQEYADAVEGQ